MPEPFDLDLLDDEDPFEIDDQAAHLFKHRRLGVEDIYDVWQSDPLFYPAKPPAHWLMVAEVAGVVLVVPLAPSGSDDRIRYRPIGGYVAAKPPRHPLPGGPMTKKKMTREEEYEFYDKPENQEPQGPARRRKRSNLTEMVPVRFPPETLEEVRRLAEADDRSVSSWIRRAVEHELEQQAG